MNIIADTHLHFYPCYDLGSVLKNLSSNMGDIEPNGCHLAFLAERFDCHYFQNIRDQKSEIVSPSTKVTDFNEAVLLQENSLNDLFLFAGRQVISHERLEVLALTTDMEIRDGLPVYEIIERINDAGAIAVLSWAPGKWFGKRGKIVDQLLRDFSANEFLLGDTTLRPWCWLQPFLMKKAVKSGFSILAGSDPLPFPGEEKMMGKYITRWQMEFDAEDPVASVRDYLKGSGIRLKSVGNRGLCIETLKRLYKNAKSKGPVG